MCLAIPEELHNNKKEEELHNNKKEEELHNNKKEEELHNNKKEEELLQPEQVPLPSQYFKAQQYKGAPIMIQTRHRCLLAIG
jgi:hypothetical protein